jgi:hypothetical protein
MPNFRRVWRASRELGANAQKPGFAFGESTQVVATVVLTSQRYIRLIFRVPVNYAKETLERAKVVE